MSDIIPNVVVSMPSQLFTLARKFQAASNGKIFIGKIDTDPTLPENQIQVYLENEDGSHIPATQPLIINQAGFPVFGGQIAKFVTVEGHSMAVYDSYGVQQHYYPNVLKYDPDRLRQELNAQNGFGIIGRVPDIETLRRLEPRSDKEVVSLIEHTLGSNVGAGWFQSDYSDSSSSDDNGTIIVTQQGKRWKRIYELIKPEYFGVNSKKIESNEGGFFWGEERISRRIGDIYFSPFPSFELDFGEFEANGAPFSIDSQVGAALKGLSFAYRMAWGIVESSGYINLPNMYDKDGCGLYMRAGQVGDGHSDAQVPVNGSFSIKSFGTSGDVPTVIDREGAFYAESGSGTNTGTSTTPITSTATTPRPNQRVFIDSNRNHIAFIEARTKSRMMTPVIFLGVKNVTTDKGLKIDGADNKEPWFYVKQSGSQSKNTIQGVYIKSGAVYSMQPYYTSGSETHIEVSVSTINGDIANRIIYSSDGYHQGLGVASINGERYIITSASKSSSIGHQSTGIAVFAEGELKGGTENKAEIYRVFDNNTRGMVSPSITEDSSLLCVAQYNQDATEITIRVIDLYNLIKNNILNIVNEFKIKEKNPSSPMFYSAINKDRIFTLTSGGVNASDEVVISELTHKGELIASHTIKCGVSLSEAKYNGKLEPECLFFLNGELYYVPAIGESGKKVNPVYKIGELS
ncbi:TPA: phage tailspike protein [Proteus mirabilis]